MMSLPIPKLTMQNSIARFLRLGIYLSFDGLTQELLDLKHSKAL